MEFVYDVQPQIINGRTMVPLRAIFEAIGATVVWNKEDRSIDSTRGERSVYMQIDNYNIPQKGDVALFEEFAVGIDGNIKIQTIPEKFQIFYGHLGKVVVKYSLDYYNWKGFTNEWID